MKQFKLLAVAVGAALLVAACGGGSDPAPAAIVKPTTLVSFGDSLSDVGTYKVGTVAALGGGTYSVNGISGAGTIPTKNWTELLAATMGTTAPCAAQTGLDGLAAQGFSVPVVDHAGCFNYAQGGARVTDLVGPGNKALGGGNATLGQLTVPIVTQISNHLARAGGSFSGTELVTVMAGANDVFMLLGALSANATAAGSTAFGNALLSGLVALVPNPADRPAATVAIGTALQVAAAAPGATPTTITIAAVTAASGQPGVTLPIDSTPIVAAASAAATAAGTAYGQANGAAQAVFPMGELGKVMAGYIKTQIVGKGAKYVVVANIPDVSSTPFGLSQSAATQSLILNMVVYFNEVLAFELKNVPEVRIVDTFGDMRKQIANPAAYGFTNVTTPACDLSSSVNPLGSSLVCKGATNTPANTIKNNAGEFIDVSHYLFADSVHPTPYGYKLLADLVSANLRQAGWL